jgi:glutamate synthase domain-containing protein 3
LWREQWPAIVIKNSHGGGTLTTPSIDGDVVYVSTREGRCFATCRVTNRLMNRNTGVRAM